MMIDGRVLGRGAAAPTGCKTTAGLPRSGGGGAAAVAG